MTGHEKDPPGGVGQTIIGDTAARERLTHTLLEECDRVDAGKRFIDERLEHLRERALKAIELGDLKGAAKVYEDIARVWRACSFPGQARWFEQRARELRNEARRAARGH